MPCRYTTCRSSGSRRSGSPNSPGAAAGFGPESIAPVIRPHYDELFARLEHARLIPTGPAIAYYEDDPDDRVLVHAAVPVNAEPGDRHDVSIVDLPEVEQAATVLHRGSMDGVMPTIQALARWIDDHGHRSGDYNRELYIEYCEDADARVTELQEPIVGD